MNHNYFKSAFIAAMTLLSATAFSQTTESFPSQFNAAGATATGGPFTGSQGAWGAVVAANSIIEVDGTTFTSTPYALRMATTGNNATSSTATSPKVSLVYGSCQPSALTLNFQLRPVDATSNTNYTLTLQYSSDDGANWTNSGWSQTDANLNNIEDQWNAISVNIPAVFWTSSFRYRFVSNRASGNADTDLLIDDIGFTPLTTGPAFPDFSDATPMKTTDGGAPGGSFEVGDVYRFDNVITSPHSIYAEVKIEAIVNAVIVNLDNNAVGVAQRFQPRIRPDVLPLVSDREGYVQFSITFRETSDNSLEFLEGLRYRHFDVDGSTTTTGTGAYSFRETGWITGHSSLLVNSPSDLGDGGTIVDAGPPINTSWKKVLGELDEHTDLSNDPDVYFTATYGAINSIRFRLGYSFDEIGSNASYDPGTTGREYGTEFGCFDLVSQSTLPVKLLSFSGTYRNQSALLNWETVNEQSFDHFELERSTNGSIFSPIANKQATGTVNYSSRQSYNHLDDLSATAGTVFYYRLKMIDIDGNSKYSNIILIRKEEKNINGISVSPNPANTDVITVRVSATSRALMDIKIIDMAGRVMLQQQNKVSEGTNSISFGNISKLKPGIYVVQLSNGQEVLNTKLSVVR